MVFKTKLHRFFVHVGEGDKLKTNSINKMDGMNFNSDETKSSIHNRPHLEERDPI